MLRRVVEALEDSNSESLVLEAKAVKFEDDKTAEDDDNPASTHPAESDDEDKDPFDKS